MKFSGKFKTFTKIAGAILLLGAVFTGVYVAQQQQFFQEQASGGGCGGRSKKTCEESCSPAKGKDLKSYKCKWHNKTSKCSESNQTCGPDNNTTTGKCGDRLDCNEATITGASPCINPADSKPWNCCPKGYVIDGKSCKKAPTCTVVAGCSTTSYKSGLTKCLAPDNNYYYCPQ